ncbi:hypothetical protein G7062_11275 [Erysipelothrix sp. HDW6C]|uniref:hypothetical protein n=1 Tax=Erysipelothrix sp. HDW6C TaxID=2714930 RepID=UPI00140C1C38|nr:hypothetical protein [Erysipelothrix sp. HDW6C]QIK70839.1 hypothetical protein G7062_11275 [Erysipelothrix sp. HDW6C]
MIEAVRGFLRGFSKIEETDIFNVEYLPEYATSFSLIEEQMVNGGILNTFLNGVTRREYRVTLQCVFDYDKALEVNVDNSSFLKDFQEWIEQQNDKEEYPMIPRIQSMKVDTTPYLQAVSADQTQAIYLVGLLFIYLK